MRIADKMAYEQVNRSITKNRTEMANLQNQAATQKRVTRPSDDPISAARVLGERVDLRGNEQYIKNLNYAKSFLDYSEQSLGDLSDIIVRAKDLTLSQSNDASANAQTRRSVAEEIKQLREHAIQVGNRKLGERFIFAGYKTMTSPFEDDGSYSGDDGELKIHIDKDSFLPMNMPGSFIFEGKGLSKDGFTHHAANQPKTVEDLQDQRKERPGEFKNNPNFAQARQARINAQGEASNAKSEASSPGKSGGAMRGPASVRITDQSLPVQVSESAKDGKFYEGINLFDALKKLEISLTTNDKTGIQDSIDRMDDGLQQVVVARSALGSRVSTIDSTLNAMSAKVVDSRQAISSLEDVDTFEVISDMNRTESALHGALQTSGKLMQKSLMDFVQI